MSPKVSVIVPIYNVEKYLYRCLESLLNQTMKDIEIILINDGSTDKSPEICEEYKKRDKKITVIHKLNGGVSDARNAGLEISKGEYILFIDPDDWCDCLMIEKLYKKAKKNKSDIAVCSYVIEYTNNNFSVMKMLDTKIDNSNNISEAIYLLDEKNMFNVLWNKLYRKDIITENNLVFAIDGVPGEDLLFNCDIFESINSISFIDECLYHYMREDEDTLVSKYIPNLYYQVERFNKARKDLYDSYNMTLDKYTEIYANTYIAYIFTCIPNMYRKNADLNWEKRNIFFNSILTNKHLAHYMNLFTEQNFHYRLFKLLFQIGNPIFANLIYSILFGLKKRFEKLYRIIRKKILLKS